jgi:hypothetical protein
MSLRRMACRFVALLLISIAPVVVLAQSVARPDWKVGDSWTVAVSVNAGFGASTRREEARTVKEAGDGGYVLEFIAKAADGTVAAPETNNFSRDLNFIAPSGGVSGGPQEFKWLQWPLEPGKSYQFETMVQNSVATWKGKIVGWEEVVVPAGKFKALRLEFDRSGPFRYAAQDSVWYAPDAKAVVKRIQSRPGGNRANDVTTNELFSYKLN